MSRLENGRSRPDPDDVADLLDLYGADDELREELLGITREAGDMRGWLRKFPVMTQQQRGFAELEAGLRGDLGVQPGAGAGPVADPGVRPAPDRLPAALGADGEPETAATGGPGDRGRARQARQVAAHRRARRAPLHGGAGGGGARPAGRAAGGAATSRSPSLCELAMLPNVTLHLLPRDTRIADWYLPPTAFSLYRFADPLDPETLAIEGGFTDVMSTEQ